ncbi:cytochrome P450 CYP82D47-like [Cryptomeria japonica]|uniref:cytochrome P450 CYP82D47-like n=1 Tax=Cryptomeria japonica TaxID=3369 RepID=UPI0027DA4970|nr:cytochrome P450 CYP82D47-like [Cryptomeria japonica]
MENKRMMNSKLLYILSSMHYNFTVGFATVFLCAIIVVWLKKDRSDRRRLPPGPRALPIVGHFHLLIDKEKPFHRILDSLSKVYGPIMHLKFGSRPVLIISSSELAKECFTIQTYRPKRMRQICKTLDILFQHAQMKTTVNMRSVLSQMTLNVLMSMIMGDRYFGEQEGVSYAEIAHLVEESFMLHGIVNTGDYIPWLKWLDLQGYERAMKKVQGKINPYMQKIVEKHQENPPEEKEEMDFIDVLILQAEENSEAIPDKDTFIKATAMNIFSAGSDTFSLALEWALSLLILHPTIMKMAQEELDSKIGKSRLAEESDMPKLKYLQAIVKETLRLFPPGPLLVPHESIKACTIGGFHILVGTILIVNAWAIHRDPRIWNQPLEFILERFLEKNIERESIQSLGNEFEMFPFGVGRRGCPGSSLATCLVHITLARLLQSFDWFLPDDKSEGEGGGARGGATQHGQAAAAPCGHRSVPRPGTKAPARV